MNDKRTLWEVHDNGMKIWYDGELVGKIHPSDFKYVLADLALWLRHHNPEDTDNGAV